MFNPVTSIPKASLAKKENLFAGEFMVKQVEKKSGEVEPFIREKIVVSCLKTGAPLSVAREIADMVEASQMESMTSKEIRENVLGELEKSNEEYRRNWIMYDREKGRITPE